ncbi:putative coiled-coil domain-containing protein 106-like, partial [Triplophysa rosa]
TSKRTKKGAAVSQNAENVAPTATHEMALLRHQLEAEKEKGALKDDTINLLKEDKAYLQSELARKDEFIRELISNKKEEIPGPSRYLDMNHTQHKRKKTQKLEKSDESDDDSSVLSDSSVELPNKSTVRKHMRQTLVPKSDHARVRVKNIKGIVARYKLALEAFKKGSSMKAAFESLGLDRATIARTAVVAELKLAAPEAFDTIAPWNERVEKLSTFIVRCRAAISSDIKEKIFPK